MKPTETCRWCRTPLPPDATFDQLYCGKRCRQTAYRARQVSLMEGEHTRKRLAYGDPPYPGMAQIYKDEPTFAGEVDHAALIAELVTYDGWALSTSAKTLKQVLALCPPEALVGSWVKPDGVSSKARGPKNAWEPVIYVPARRVQGVQVRDWLSAKPARGGGYTLPGRKPLAFWRWLFQLLGASPGDEFVDKYPGTGVGSMVWRQLSPPVAPGDPGFDVALMNTSGEDPSFAEVEAVRERITLSNEDNRARAEEVWARQLPCRCVVEHGDSSDCPHHPFADPCPGEPHAPPPLVDEAAPAPG